MYSYIFFERNIFDRQLVASFLKTCCTIDFLCAEDSKSITTLITLNTFFFVCVCACVFMWMCLYLLLPGI